MLSELYGCTGWEFNFRSHKMIGDWQALFGVNLRCPHLSWYTMEGECKRDYPASISYQSPYWADYNFVESYFARLGVMLSEGRPVCDLLVVSPIESVWGLSHLGWADWIFPVSEDVKKVEQTYQDTFMKLAEARVDFDYGDEQMMQQHYRIEGDTLYIGSAPYRSVLICGMLTIRSTTLSMLQSFLKAGGRVIFSGKLPEYVDGERSDACQTLLDTYENAVYTDFETLGDFALSLDSNPIRSDAASSVFNQVRSHNGDYISVWLNTDRENAAPAFSITASLPDTYRAELWVPETGERFVYPSAANNGVLTVSASLEAAGTMILVFTQNTEELPVYQKVVMVQTGCLSGGEYAYTLDEPNVAVLDYARFRFEGSEFSGYNEVLKIDQQIRDQLQIEHRGGEMLQPWFAKKNYTESYGRLTLEYPFEAETLPQGNVYLAAERPELQEYYCNGVRLHYESLSDWWVDNAFVKMQIPEGTLVPGKNTITIVTDFKRTTNTEAVYLLGDFGVKANAGASVITTLPQTLSLDDMAKRNLPFYSGRATVEIPAESYLSQTDETAEHIYVQVPAFTGALVTVEYGDTKKQIAWEPYTAEITEAVKKRLPLRITQVNTRRNSFGPLHIVPTIQRSYGPDSFLTAGDRWSDEYSLIEASIGEIRFLK